jgi:protoheme IX farnesyltransferase
VTKERPGVVLDAFDAKRLAISFSTGAVPASRHRATDFFSLTKPRLNFLVVITAAVGYYLGAGGSLDVLKWVEAVIGTALVAGGAAGLNQVSERDTDRVMWRTRTRPLAAQRLTVTEATIFSMALATAGLAILAGAANMLATSLALATLISYNIVYTPMKRYSQLATLVGAIPGALPPMIGWAAARGSLTGGAWALFAIVFVWQIPHFMAIAWLYRDDFRRAGFPLPPVVHPDGRSTARQAILFSIFLVPVSLAPFVFHMAGQLYAAGALVGSLGLLATSAAFAGDRTDQRARQLFIGSITYLPLLWVLLIADRL